ncbi:hypothetical protein [Algibacter luteus]|uniref:hypothetical protein n=1 Tax=Algibacter luteus TaxID=1178825 RepID=UPI0025971F99|nr:hypothetical protein [Algibacter luteus]WJJ97173.1 hypothetical protein O5O44_02080 [Algibacter luteus]
MKNVIKNTKKGILMVALMATVSSFATNTDASIKTGVKKTALVLKNVKQGNILSIIDSNGIILYKEAIAINGDYKKAFDLTELPDGDYVFELEKDLEIKTIPFSIASDVVSMNAKNEVSYFKPFVKQINDLVYVSKLNLSQEDTKINIFENIEGTYTLVHSEKFENEKTIHKAFKLNKGNYKIEINSINTEYTTFINN